MGTQVGTLRDCTQKGVSVPKLATPLTDNQIRHAIHLFHLATSSLKSPKI